MIYDTLKSAGRLSHSESFLDNLYIERNRDNSLYANKGDIDEFRKIISSDNDSNDLDVSDLSAAMNNLSNKNFNDNVELANRQLDENYNIKSEQLEAGVEMVKAESQVKVLLSLKSIAKQIQEGIR